MGPLHVASNTLLRDVCMHLRSFHIMAVCTPSPFELAVAIYRYILAELLRGYDDCGYDFLLFGRAIPARWEIGCTEEEEKMKSTD